MKHFLFLLFLLPLGSGAKSEDGKLHLEKGDWQLVVLTAPTFIGVDADGGIGRDKIKRTEQLFKVTIKQGYFLFSKFSIGILGDYERQVKSENDGFEKKESDNTLISFAPHLVYYFGKGKLKPHISTHMGYTLLITEDSYYQPVDTYLHGITWGGELGVSYFIFPKIAVDFQFILIANNLNGTYQSVPISSTIKKNYFLFGGSFYW